MGDVTQLIPGLLASKASLIVLGFCAITVLAWAKAGRDALEWRPELRRCGYVNVALTVFNVFAFILPLTATVFVVSLAQDVPHLAKQIWQDAPWIIRALAALIIYDLVNYTMHRICHASPVLWPLHGVHHSDTELHYLSATRAHVLEWVLVWPMIGLASFICGLSIEDVVMLALLRDLHQFYVHSNLDWSHGPLRYVIASPRFHRWHHVDRPEAYNKNFSLFFPVIDLVFGTYHVPGPAKAEPTGFAGNPGNDVVKLLLFPFTEWRRQLKQALARPARLERQR